MHWWPRRSEMHTNCTVRVGAIPRDKECSMQRSCFASLFNKKVADVAEARADAVAGATVDSVIKMILQRSQHPRRGKSHKLHGASLSRPPKGLLVTRFTP
eukprot:scaffold298414_cov32-Tisochrysis_lutea.AAC.1